MQSINATIVNGWFAISFFGPVVLTAVAAVLYLPDGNHGVLGWIVAALVLYAATIAITAAVNVPLNNELAVAGDAERIADLAALRAHFEPAWVRWNVVRAMTSTGALGCLVSALALHR